MKRVSSKRPSPALVISILALFVALGGSAYAANKIGTNDIKANAITAGKIKKNAVTTAKIKSNAVTGAKINEGTLGAVPNATNAVNAVNATNAVNSTNFSRYVSTGLVRASAGHNVLVLQDGPFAVTGHCLDLGGGAVRAFAVLTTDQPGSSASEGDGNAYVNADFDPGDELEIGFSAEGSGPQSNDTYGGYYDSFTAASGDAHTFLNGEIASAINYYGATCSFWGHAVNNA
ncbi:MAG TPA: hypothetical protein VGC49_09795 [Solirubrobacterales bacterium]|jgi:hypothetical protein